MIEYLESGEEEGVEEYADGDGDEFEEPEESEDYQGPERLEKLWTEVLELVSARSYARSMNAMLLRNIRTLALPGACCTAERLALHSRTRLRSAQKKTCRDWRRR